MRVIAIALAVLLLLALGAVAAGAFVLRGGITARIAPTRLEAAVARKLRQVGIPRAARDLRNPEPSSNDILAEGRAHFADHCAVCHANDGSGHTEMGRNLFPPAPDLRLGGTQELTDGELFYIIENGIRLTGMPAWGDGSEQSEKETWHLVSFMRHLPRLTPGEKLQMERLNPKSPAEWREIQEDEEFLQGKEQSGSGAHHGSHQ